jgi:hypothetical protein
VPDERFVPLGLDTCEGLGRTTDVTALRKVLMDGRLSQTYQSTTDSPDQVLVNREEEPQGNPTENKNVPKSPSQLPVVDPSLRIEGGTVYS